MAMTARKIDLIKTNRPDSKLLKPLAIFLVARACAYPRRNKWF